MLSIEIVPSLLRSNSEQLLLPEKEMAEKSQIKGDIESLDQLPGALLATIMMKLDLASICSVASTCRTFKACASQILHFIPVFHLLVCIFSSSN